MKKIKDCIIFYAVTAVIFGVLLFGYDKRTPLERSLFFEGELYYLGNMYAPLEEKVSDDEAKVIHEWIKTLTIIDEELVHYPYIEPAIKIAGEEQSVGLRNLKFKSDADYPYSHAYRGEQMVVLVYPHIEEIGIQYACLAVSDNQELGDEVNKMWERAFDKKYPDYPK